MKTPIFTLIVGIFIFPFFTFSCRNDFEPIEKSFVVIDSVNHEVLSKNSAFISFELFNLESPSHVNFLTVTYYPKDSAIHKIDTVIGGFLRSVTLKDLIPETEYCYTITAKMKSIVPADTLKTNFTSDEFCFETPSITVLTDNLYIESDKELKVIAFGRIDGFLPEDRATIDSVGHIWKNSEGKLDTTISIEEISDEGTFKSELFNYDFTEKYEIRAFVKEIGKELVTAGTKTDFCSESEGDFWVNLADLSDSWPGKGMLAREGAISFVSNGFAYVGLGHDQQGFLDDFWKYDPSQNSWEKIGNFPDSRMHSLMFQNDLGNVFVGLGCNPCEEDKITDQGFKNDFYQFNPTDDTWKKIPELSLIDRRNSPTDNDKDNTEKCITNKIDEDDDSRYGAYVFEYRPGSSQPKYIYLGNGIGKTIKEGDLDASMSLEKGEWIDYKDNGVLEHREWVDHDGNGVFNIGAEWSDLNLNGIVDPGEFNDIPMTGGNGYIDAGEWADINNNGVNFGVVNINNEWTDGGNLNCMIDAGEWHDFNRNGKIDNITRPHPSLIKLFKSEWVEDTSNPFQIDGYPDEGDITHEYDMRTDLWRINPNNLSDGWELVDEISGINAFGRPIMKRGNNVFIISDEEVIDPNSSSQGDFVKALYKFNKNNDEKWVETVSGNSIEFPNRLFAASFRIKDDETYLCGGQNRDGKIAIFDIFETIYAPKTGQNLVEFKERTACGLSGLTKGIGFSIGDKGYVGIGRISGSRTN